MTITKSPTEHAAPQERVAAQRAEAVTERAPLDQTMPVRGDSIHEPTPSVAIAAPSLEPGTLVPPYRVVRAVGRGGMGDVYLARDTQLGRKVALKVVRPTAIGDREEVARFLLEARITARFSHPHIVTVYGAGEHEGRPYVALEFLEGQTLRERMDEHRLGLREILRVGLAIAEALQEAHRHQVLHRDLKPENVFLPRDGRLRVVDFGLAVALHLPEVLAEAHELDDFPKEFEQLLQKSFERGGIEGTPLYMSPEQWKGMECTPKTDSWALGVVLFELLSGKLPFNEHSNMAQLIRVCSADAAPSMQPFEPLPEALDDLVNRCLAKESEERPEADEIVRVLHDLLYPGRGRLDNEESPFRGLLPFSEQQADVFYGRDNEVAAFLERLRHEPLLPLVGPSGAGKSSFVQAGLIPRLREQGRWIILRLRPGREPFEALAMRLVRGERDGSSRLSSSTTSRVIAFAEGAREIENDLNSQLRENPALLSLRLHQLSEEEDAWVLLFVDQLEEVYTLVDDPEIRRRYMVAVCGAADDPESRVRVVLTLRDDFMVRLAETRQAREALEHVTVLRSPGPEALREILQRPVQLAGYRYEEQALVDEMIASVGYEPGALPLIQVAASQLWEERDRKGKALRRDAYERMGGVEGALARQADGVLEGLTPAQVQVARELCLRLVTPEHTRRLVSRDELLEGLGSDGEEVLRRLVAGRAVIVRRGRSSTGGDVELVHESLVRSWTRLSRWLEESREELAFLGEVGQAAELWAKRGSPREEVWRGPALQEALLKADRIPVIPERIRAFLEAGRRRERRGTQRRRTIAAAAFGLLVVVAAVLALQSREAWIQRNVAEQQRERAETQRVQADEKRAEALREGASAALTREEMLEARAKVRVSLEVDDAPPARTLWDRLRSQSLQAVTRLPARAWTAKFMPGGQSVAALDVQGAVHIIDVATTRSRRVSKWNVANVAEASFSADGRYLVSTVKTGEIRVWDLEKESVATIAKPPPRFNWFTLSPNGQYVASVHATGDIHLWDVKTGKQARALRGHRVGVTRATFGPTSDVLASGDLAGEVRLWNLSTGVSRSMAERHDKLVSCLAFGAGGRLLATSDWGGGIRLWDVASGKLLRKLRGHVGAVYRVRFSPDGKRLASVSGDKTIRLWRVEDGSLLRTLHGHKDQVYDVDFEPDGSTLMTLDGLGALHFWSLETAVRRVRLGRHTGSVFGIDFHPSNGTLVSASRDQTIRMWNVKTGHVEAVLEGHDAGVLGVEFSPDGHLLVSGGNDHTVRIWDAERHVQLHVLSGHHDAIVHPTFSPNGELVASPSNDGTVRIWDVQTGDKVQELRGHTGGVNQASFSPDGLSLATGADDGTVRIWNVMTGAQRRVLRGHTAAVYGPRFDPSGKYLVSGGWDGETRMWSLADGSSRVLHQCDGYAFFPSFDRDGKRVGATCADGTAYVLDPDGASKVELRGHVGHVTDVRFSPDVPWVATSGDDGTVRLWDSNTGWPVWHATFLRSSPAEAYTHEGWVPLDDRARPADAAWRKAVATRARIATSQGEALCMATHDGVVDRWDLAADKRAWSKPAANVVRLVAHPRGCLVLQADGVASLLVGDGESVSLETSATAIGGSDEELLVAVNEKVWRRGFDGKRLGSFTVEGRVTALARLGKQIAVGTVHGDVKLVPIDQSDQPRAVRLAGLPSAAVAVLLEGPAGTLVAGFSDGTVGAWDLLQGSRVHTTLLHGRVLFIERDGGKVHALSELGDHDVLDLSVLLRPYCDVMREVWGEVPVVWEGGRAIRRRAPKGHPCAGEGK
jgi:WD40 repeat protein/serine/threonine protein kinase